MPSDPPASTDLESLNARLAAIVVSSEDGIVSKTLDGVVQSWNEAAQRIFGWSSAEMIGQEIMRLVPPHRRDEELEILARIRRGERVEHFRTERVRKDGRRIYVSITVSPITDGHGRIVGASKIVRDISHAADLEARYEAIIASADDAIIAKDLDGIVLSWNGAAEKIFGYTAEEMIGQPLLRLFPPDRVEEETQILGRIRRGERVEHFQTVRLHKTGRRIAISATISPIRAPTGDVIGASKIARDVTALEDLTRQREDSLRRANDARLDAERSNRVKDEFLATLSHELRTPLQSVLGWADLLKRDRSPRNLDRGLDTIERNARAQLRLIEDLLDVSRIISGKMRLHVALVNLATVVADPIDSMVPAAAAKGVRIVRDLPEDIGNVLADPERIQQLVWNLVSNALRHTPNGGTVEISLRRTADHMVLAVSDTGEGIDPDYLPAIFARFSQADSSLTRRHGGLGLGLAIVRHLVELHGGTVAAASEGIDRGSTFTVQLPLAGTLPDPAADASPDANAEVSDAAPLAGTRVLVIDDYDDGRELMVLILEGAGATVSAVGGAHEAIALLTTHAFDVLVSDIAMPDMDGYDLITKLRADGITTPAIAITAFVRASPRRALDAGFQMFLTKPLQPSVLCDAVARLAGRVPKG